MHLAKKNVQVSTRNYDYGVVDLFVTRYVDGTLALAISEEYGPEVISTNLSGYGMKPAKNSVFIKDYSEHDGLTASLVAAGVVEPLREVAIGYGRGYEVQLNFDAEALF